MWAASSARRKFRQDLSSRWPGPFISCCWQSSPMDVPMRTCERHAFSPSSGSWATGSTRPASADRGARNHSPDGGPIAMGWAPRAASNADEICLKPAADGSCTNPKIAMNAPAAVTPPYKHTPLFPLGADTTPYRKLTADGVRSERVGGHDLVVVEREALRALAEAAFTDINHLLRPGHLKQLRAILDDPQASDNDKFVAYDFLKNANIAAGGVLPMCQDTGTAIIMGKKGRLVFTDGDDEAALAEGARDAYLKRNLRYSQLAPISMFEERNTKSNMPAQVEIYAEGEDDAYKMLFIAKGGGSANKAF